MIEKRHLDGRSRVAVAAELKLLETAMADPEQEAEMEDIIARYPGSEAAGKAHGFTPRARIVAAALRLFAAKGWHVGGCDLSAAATESPCCAAT